MKLSQNRSMLSQVVLDPSHSGASFLRLNKVTPGERHVLRRGTELHLGSQDLARFAGYAETQGFQVKAFLLADSHDSPLDINEESAISEQMLTILRKYGIDELEDALHDEFAGIWIVGVKLIESESGFRTTVKREGYIETSRPKNAEKLIKSAWKKLQLT